MPWGIGLSTTWTPFSPGANPAIASPDTRHARGESPIEWPDFGRRRRTRRHVMKRAKRIDRPAGRGGGWRVLIAVWCTAVWLAGLAAPPSAQAPAQGPSLA